MFSVWCRVFVSAAVGSGRNTLASSFLQDVGGNLLPRCKQKRERTPCGLCVVRRHDPVGPAPGTRDAHGWPHGAACPERGAGPALLETSAPWLSFPVCWDGGCALISPGRGTSKGSVGATCFAARFCFRLCSCLPGPLCTISHYGGHIGCNCVVRLRVCSNMRWCATQL